MLVSGIQQSDSAIYIYIYIYIYIKESEKEYVYIHISIMGSCKILSIVPCAIQ